MRSRILSAAFLVFVLIAAAPLGAYAMGGPMGRGSGKAMVDRMAKDLDLTKEQKSRLLEMIMKTENETTAIEAQNKAMFNKMQAEMQKDDPNKAVITESLTKIGQNRTQAEIKRMNTLLEFKRYLTSKQMNKFREMQKRQDKFHGKKEKETSRPSREQMEKMSALTPAQLEAVGKLTPDQIGVLKDLTPKQLEMIREMKAHGFKNSPAAN